MSQDSDDTRMERFAKGNAKLLQPLVNTLEARLIQEAEDSEGQITLEQLESIGDGLRNDFSTLSSFIFNILQKFKQWDGQGEFRFERRDILGRLIVNRFEELLEGHHPGGIEGGALPRITVSGLLRGFRSLAGDQLVEDLTGTVSEIQERIADTSESSTDKELWAEYYSDSQSSRCMVRLAMQIAPHFKKYNRRRDWFVNMINVHIAPVQVDSNGNRVANPWEFSERHFVDMMLRFTLDTQSILDRPDGESRLRSEFDADQVDGFLFWLEKLREEARGLGLPERPEPLAAPTAEEPAASAE